MTFSDLYICAAYIALTGARVTGMTKAAGRQFWVLECPENSLDVEAFRRDFYSGLLRVDPQAMMTAIRQLKHWLYDTPTQNEQLAPTAAD